MADPVANANSPYVGFNADRWVGYEFNYAQLTAAGTLTASFILPADTFILDIGIVSVALWVGPTACTIIVGDADDPNGFIVSTDLLATDLLATESIWIGSGGTSMAGGKIGAYIANSQWTSGSGTYGQFSTAVRTITATLTGTVAAATAGRTFFLCRYLNFSGSEPIKRAVFAAT